MSHAALPKSSVPTPTQETLLKIVEQLSAIRMTIKESNGHGFLINAEKNILYFLSIYENQTEAQTENPPENEHEKWLDSSD